MQSQADTNGAAVPSCGRRHAWPRPLWRTLAALLLAAVGLGGYSVYRGVADSLQSEENLHATLFTIRLVEEFVAERGRWPSHWDELEGLTSRATPPTPAHGKTTAVLIGGKHAYDWPVASAKIRQRVAIDFAADVAVLAQQDPMEFAAIRPIGPCYEYRDYGLVLALQETIRRSVNAPAGTHRRRQDQ